MHNYKIYKMHIPSFGSMLRRKGVGAGLVVVMM